MKRSFITSLILVSLIIIPIVLSASLSVDRTPPEYYHGQDVIIDGNGFEPNEDLVIEIWDQTEVTPIRMIDVTTDPSGYFQTTYTVPGNARTERHDVYAIRESPSMPNAQTYFDVIEDEKPEWSNFNIQPQVVTTLDDVEIRVTWSDDRDLDNALIWENTTGNWVSHIVYP